MKNIIYLDNQATTPIDPEVLKFMKPYLNESFGNASSSSHILGWQAEESIEIARESISNTINSKPDEIIFTSGATESVNVALKGLIGNHINDGDHIITSNIEHKVVVDVLNHLTNFNIKISFVSVDKNGIIDPKKIEELITKRTKLCTMIHGNNEIGTIQPIEQIGYLCKKNNILFHVDAAQTLGKRKIDVDKFNIDLLSISGHKMYAPKGVGALFIKRKNPRINLNPLFHGGGQENGYRPGTLPVHNIVGLGKACDIANSNYKTDNEHIKKLSSILLNGLKKIFPNLILNGDSKNRLEGNLNITFPDFSAEKIMMTLTKIACSTGSACSSSDPEPSHVLKALNLSKHQINNTIRFGIGKFNTEKEMKLVVKMFENKLRKIK
ncbi:MAG: IscS subfamily cysteine desulfurase [Candidatus Marinimicrobia bacterium]|nr:IscS subfamily cysteine desulfurase [Candidatus Neomarinimicrobiota bacterium]|tara:strand:+ start:1898 stop:3043 length:1146 start_codon:yes stop_codon:yes gene_type:complete